MTKPILVGYDPGAADRAPVEFGLAAARLTGAPLVVVSVDRSASEPYDVDLVEDCGPVLDALDNDLRAAGVAVRCRRVRSTSAARALHDAAEAEDAGLLVVGSSRRSPVGRVLLGSTAERLMHGATCPVAVVPREYGASDDGPSDIGVAYVDTDEGREALRGAYALARRAGATLHVITVAQVRPDVHLLEEDPGRPAGQLERKDWLDVEGVHKIEAERQARAAVAEVDAGDGAVEVHYDALVGDPAEQIVEMSKNLDLLVCGSRGYGPLRAVLLGSVSRRVTAEAHCPVIVVPRGVTASLEALLAESASTAT